MPNPEFFTRLGLLIIKDFFDDEMCATLRLETTCGAVELAEVVRGSSTVDGQIRRTKRSNVSSSALDFVNKQLRDLRKQVELHFHKSLINHQEPQFLIYEKGDFYRQHRDAYDGKHVPEYLQARRISIVIFLNSHSDEPTLDTYGGGSLILYGLLDKPGSHQIWVPLADQQGTMG